MTQTRSRTIKDNVLEEISGKLSSLDDEVSILIEYIQKLKNSVQCFQVKFNEFIPNEPIQNECDFVKQTTENNYKTYVDAITQSRNEFHSQNSVHEKKKEITIWKKMLNERKQAYWNAVRCENLADVYEKWRQNEEVILPRKFRPKPIDNEPEEETRIRRNLAIQKFEAEISLYASEYPSTRRNTRIMIKKCMTRSQTYHTTTRK